MRKLFPLLLLICFTAQAQVRTYSDNASGTFVFGLDSYFYGESGTRGIPPCSALKFVVELIEVR